MPPTGPSAAIEDATDVQPLLQGRVSNNPERTSVEASNVAGSGQPWLRWLWRGPATPPSPSTTTEPQTLVERSPSSSIPQPNDPLLPPNPTATLPIPRPLSSHTIAIPSSSSATSSLLPTASASHPATPPSPSPPSPPPSPSARLLPARPRSPGSSPSSSQGSLNRSDSGPQCLICLETLTPEDFESGEAMSLECLCKGDNALRHRSCAIKWTEMRGTRTCELCKTTVGNLPEPPPRPPSPRHQLIVELSPPFDDVLDSVASPEHSAVADQVFDCIRVMWVTMIIGILWFQMPVGPAFLVGSIVGLLYSAFCYMLQRYCHQQQAGGEGGVYGEGGYPSNIV